MLFLIIKNTLVISKSFSFFQKSKFCFYFNLMIKNLYTSLQSFATFLYTSTHPSNFCIIQKMFQTYKYLSDLCKKQIFIYKFVNYCRFLPSTFRHLCIIFTPSRKIEIIQIGGRTMKKNYPRYTLRIPQNMMAKLAYIADFNGRTKNKEIEMIIRRHIYDYERSYGTIPLPAALDDDDD